MATAPTLLGATGAFLFNPLGWAMDVLAEAGFDAVEVLFNQSVETRDPERVRGYAREAGLTVPVVHGPYMIFLRNVLGTGYVEKTRRSAELAAELGAHTLVAHAPLRWERGAAQWARDEAPDETGRLGVRFAMENLYPVWGLPFSAVVTPDELRPHRHVVFDTSHFAVAGVDLFAAWHQLRDRIVHLHVSNNLGTGSDSHAPLEQGVLPIRRFLGMVGRSGYGGTITLELDVREHTDDRAGLVRFLRGQRARAQRWLAGEFDPDLDAPPDDRDERPAAGGPEHPGAAVDDDGADRDGDAPPARHAPAAPAAVGGDGDGSPSTDDRS